MNRLKPYKERILKKVPDLATNDSFDPAEERVVDKTTLGVDEPEPENEQIVREVTQHRVKKGVLEFLTIFDDGTVRWQPEDNFCDDDGKITTEAVLRYFDRTKKPFLVALHAQVSKLKSQLKPANYPANLAVQKAKILLGNESLYLLHEDTRAQFHQRPTTFTTKKQVLDYIERILNKWEDFLGEEKHY